MRARAIFALCFAPSCGLDNMDTISGLLLDTGCVEATVEVVRNLVQRT